MKHFKPLLITLILFAAPTALATEVQNVAVIDTVQVHSAAVQKKLDACDSRWCRRRVLNEYRKAERHRQLEERLGRKDKWEKQKEKQREILEQKSAPKEDRIDRNVKREKFNKLLHDNRLKLREGQLEGTEAQQLLRTERRQFLRGKFRKQRVTTQRQKQIQRRAFRQGNVLAPFLRIRKTQDGHDSLGRRSTLQERYYRAIGTPLQ